MFFVLLLAVSVSLAAGTRPFAATAARAPVDTVRYPSLAAASGLDAGAFKDAGALRAAAVEDLLRLAADHAADASVLSAAVQDAAALEGEAAEPELAGRLSRAREVLVESLDELRRGQAELVDRRMRDLAERLGLSRMVDAPAASFGSGSSGLTPARGEKTAAAPAVPPAPLSDAVSQDQVRQAHKGLIKVLVVGAGAGLAIGAAKFAAAAVSGSSTMAAEGIHSIVDTLNKLFLWFGLRFSQKPPSAAHPYGYAREVYFWTLLVALLVFFMGSIFSIYGGIEKILHPAPLTNAGMTFSVLLFSLAVEVYAGWVGIKEYRRTFGDKPFLKTARESKDLAIIATIVEDVLAAAGVLVAMAGLGLALLLNAPILDGVTSVLIGLILGAAALFLAAETKGLLIGEGASKADLVRIRAAVSAEPKVLDIVDIDTEHRGPQELFVTMKLLFSPHMTVRELESTVVRLEDRIRAAVPYARHIYIEAGGYAPKAK